MKQYLPHILYLVIIGALLYSVIDMGKKYDSDVRKLNKEKQTALDSSDYYKRKSVDNYNFAMKAFTIADSIRLEFNELRDLKPVKKRHENDLRIVSGATVDNIDSILSAQISRDLHH